MECHSKCSVTQNGMSLKVECHSNWNVTHIECLSNLNVTKIVMSLKLECHTNWNVTQISVSLKNECHSLERS